MKKGIFARMVFGSLTFILFSLVILYSFFLGDNKKIEDPSFFQFQSGKIVHDITDETNMVSQRSDFTNTGSGAFIFEEQVDPFATIFSTKADYKVTKNNIALGEGVFFIELTNPFQKYTITTGSYNIVLENSGSIYVDTSKIFSYVASFNTVAEIIFKNQLTGDETVTLYLYPHMYTRFREARFTKEPKNIDLLRVNQLGKLGQHSYSYYETIENIEEVPYVKKKENRSFLKGVLTLLLQKNKVYGETLDAVNATNVRVFSGSSYISRYFSIFYNENKKRVYKKNMLLGNIVTFFKNDTSKELVEDVIAKISEIKTASNSDYEEALMLIEQLYLVKTQLFTEASNEGADNWHTLMSELYNRGVDYTSLFQPDFDKFNFKRDSGLYANLSKDYAKMNITTNISNKMEYYLFFMKGLIMNGLGDESLDFSDKEGLIAMYHSYSAYLDGLEFSKKNENTIMSSVVSNLVLLQNTQGFIEKSYFDGRNEDGLLLKTNENNDSKILIKAIKNSFNLYTKTQSKFLEKETKFLTLATDYVNLEKRFIEYFAALTNYGEYEKSYSDLNKNLLEAEVFQIDEDDSLSKEKIFSYLSQFNGVSQGQLDVEIIQDTYYDVNSVKINGKEFSFEMYPYSDNRITNLTLLHNYYDEESQEYNFYKQLSKKTFQLDSQKERYKQYYDKAKAKDKDQYDFRNVFTHLITIPEDIGVAEFIDDKQVVKEAPYIADFKSTKLLGKQGEFMLIKDVFTVGYNDLFVKANGSQFDIYFVNADLSGNVLRYSRKESMFATMDSNYNFSDHAFEDSIFTFYTKQGTDDNLYLFGGKKVKIKGKIKIQDFKDIFTKMIQTLVDNEDEYNQKITINKFGKITYNVDNNKLSFDK